MFLPGTVFRPATDTGLSKTPSLHVTIERDDLGQEPAGTGPAYLMTDVDAGLRLAMDL